MSKIYRLSPHTEKLLSAEAFRLSVPPALLVDFFCDFCLYYASSPLPVQEAFSLALPHFLGRTKITVPDSGSAGSPVR